MLQPRGLIFDMDGLMIDSEPLWWSVEKSLAAEHSLVWTDAMAHGCIGKGLPNAIATMQAELGLPLGIEEGVRALVEGFIARIGELVLKPGLEELLDASAVPMAVASSSTRRLIEAVLARFELRARFGAVVSGDDVTMPKPAPDIFLEAAARLGCAPADCVVFEDSIAGVRAAVAAGMPVIAVPEGAHDAFVPLTPHVVTDLHQARALLGL